MTGQPDSAFTPVLTSKPKEQQHYDPGAARASEPAVGTYILATNAPGDPHAPLFVLPLHGMQVLAVIQPKHANDRADLAEVESADVSDLGPHKQGPLPSLDRVLDGVERGLKPCVSTDATSLQLPPITLPATSEHVGAKDVPMCWNGRVLDLLELVERLEQNRRV